MEHFFLHHPLEPVYGKKGLSTGITSVVVPTRPKETAYLLSSRTNRAILAADVKAGRVDISRWPVTKIAQALGASPRSTFQALSLSQDERDEVLGKARPLFEHRSSVPEPTQVLDSATAMREIVREVGADAALDMLTAATEMVAA